MENSQKLAIAAQSSNALLMSLAKHAVCVIDTKDTADHSKWEIFSGTVVSIGSRVFVATASHCVNRNASGIRYWLLSDVRRRMSEGIPVVVASWKTPGDRPDVAALEIEPKSLSEFTSKTPCSLGRLRLVGVGRMDRAASLVGCPSQYLTQENHKSAEGIGAMLISYTSLPIAEPDWPKFAARIPFEADIDILKNYPSGNDDTSRLDLGMPIELPHPDGMSGGGLWDQGFGVNELWSTDDAFLFGIQSSWFPDRRYVRVVQICHWLQLIYQHYPDLQTEIDAAFPTLH